MLDTSALPVVTQLSVAPGGGPAGTLFEAHARVTGPSDIAVRYQWLLDGDAVAGATGWRYAPARGGRLSVIVSAESGGLSSSRTSTVVEVGPGEAAPRLLAVEVVPGTGRVGEGFAARVEATGIPAPELAFQWMMDGAPVPGAAGPAFAPARPGEVAVRVAARNPHGLCRLTSAAAPVAALEPPVIEAVVVEPAEARVGATYVATTRLAGGDGAELCHLWLLDGVPVAGATGPAVVPEAPGALAVVVTATGPGGSTRREGGPVLVRPALAPPRIKSADILPNFGSVGDTFDVIAVACGEPQPEIGIEWFLDDVPLAEAHGFSFTAREPGTLFARVTATNPLGSDVRESGAVDVEPAAAAPELAAVTVVPGAGQVGDRFTVVAAATGAPEPQFAYAWLLDGASVAGADGPDFVPDRAGTLAARVTARNPLGTATRESAPVPVAPAAAAPAIRSLRLDPAAGVVGDRFLALAEVEGYPEPQIAYQWRLDDVVLAGETGSSWLATAAGVLSVDVTATNPGGGAALSSASVIVGLPDAVGDVFAANVFVAGVFA